MTKDNALERVSGRASRSGQGIWRHVAKSDGGSHHQPYPFPHRSFSASTFSRDRLPCPAHSARASAAGALPGRLRTPWRGRRHQGCFRMVFSDDARGQWSSGGAGQRPPVATGASKGGPAPIPASPPVAVVMGRGIHGRRRAGQRPPAVATTGAGEGGPASHPRPLLLRWRRRVRDPRPPERRPAATRGGDGRRRGQPRAPSPASPSAAATMGAGSTAAGRRSPRPGRDSRLAASPHCFLHACHRRSSGRCRWLSVCCKDMFRVLEMF
jgi:hypothetical protein